MDMESSVTDRLWDKDVQEFIEACKAGPLSGITLGYTNMGDGRKFLSVTAVYTSTRCGRIPIGYSWVHSPKEGWLPEVFLGQATAPAGRAAVLARRTALKASMWRERHRIIAALEAVRQVFFKAQLVRGSLDQEHLKQCPDNPGRAQELTLQTLNDPAFLYSA